MSEKRGNPLFVSAGRQDGQRDGESLQDFLRRTRAPEPINPHAAIEALGALILRRTPRSKPDVIHVEESERP